MDKNSSLKANFDHSWKEILDSYLPWFLKLFFPNVYNDIDWSQGYQSLDKELSQITSEAGIKRRMVDKLLEVYQKNGHKARVFIHLEVQSQQRKNIAERMYIYNSLLYLRYKKPIMSLLVLGDEHPNWKPDTFGYDLWGSHIQLKYQMIKLLNFQNRLEEFKKSKNPFAYFVIAHLKTLETNKNPKKRFHYKEAITKELIHHGFSLENVQSLFKFIDILMTLPEDLEQLYRDKIYEYQEEKKMPILAPIEKMAMEKGREEGIQIGEQIGEQRGEQKGIQKGEQKGSLKEAQATILDILGVKFGEIPASLTKSINRLEDISLLRELRKQAIIVDSLKEFKEIMKKGKSHFHSHTK